MFDNYPYTDFHEMNLDWIIKEMKDLVDSWDSFSGNVSAEAHSATTPEVSVTGDLKEGLVFDFGLVAGPRGTTGAQGPQGPQGPAGEGLKILDTYRTLAALQDAHPIGYPGDAYLVGSGGAFTLYIWSTSTNAWTDGGSLSSPSPSNSNPSMDGAASAGSSLLYARGDHTHPSDTSKLDKASTDGVYAVVDGNQDMLEHSDVSLPDALVQYDSVGDINTRNLTASGSIDADSINVTNNDILNSDKLEGIGGSTDANQVLSTLDANTDVLALENDAQNNTPAIAFQGGKWGNDGLMTDASERVKFTNSFVTDPVSYPEARIGLAPASSSVLGGIKIGNGLRIDGSGVVSNVFSNLTAGSLNDINYNYQGYVTASVADKPTNSGGGLCCCMSTTGTYGIQIYTPVGSSSYIYFRSLINGVWSSWYSVNGTVVPA